MFTISNKYKYRGKRDTLFRKVEALKTTKPLLNSRLQLSNTVIDKQTERHACMKYKTYVNIKLHTKTANKIKTTLKTKINMYTFSYKNN